MEFTLDLQTTVFLLTIGFVGGVWNAMASGATLFTFPALVLVGLPPVVANATNFLALLPANAAALPACMNEIRSVGWKAILIMVIASGIGAVAGSLLLVASGNALFMNLVPYLILAATAMFAFSTQIKDAMSSGTFGKFASGPIMPLILLAVFSIYGGYFGAGLGIILLATVTIMGYSDFIVANSLKNLLATSFTIVSIIVFGLNGIIAVEVAIVMMIASTFGGYLGGVLSKKINAVYMKRFVICFGLFLGFYYLFVNLS
jgi:uncharacterized membrane protein YfcA